MELTIKQAFYAMYYLMDRYYDERNHNDLGAILGSMNPYLFEGDMPTDLAMWEDWLEIAKTTLFNESNTECLNDRIVFQTILAFLEHYQKEFEMNFEEVIDFLKLQDNPHLIKTWQECKERALQL